MLDQSFSVDNFMKIYKEQNRKGNNLADKFNCFSKVKKIISKIKTNNLEIKRNKKNSQVYNKLCQKKQELIDRKNAEIIKALETIVQKIQDSRSVINIQKSQRFYIADKNSPETYFSLKQIQYNIKKLYKVKQADRYQITAQLKQVLGDKFPKYIIRTDISNFYESIPIDRIIKKIESDHLLSFDSKKIIKQILYSYSQISKQQRGLPRGLGISAYLSELYMRELDNCIKNKAGIIYYARYVDDIIIVGVSSNKDTLNKTMKELKVGVRWLGLRLNPTKTKQCNLSNDFSFDYLGYNYKYHNNSIAIDMTKSRMDKYKERIRLSFDAYNKGSQYNEKKSRYLLVRRIKFLTGNTHLFGNKRSILVGIYFSNPLITKDHLLKRLDCYLRCKINLINNAKLKQQLNKCSFVGGYQDRKYYKFSQKNIERIVKIW